jgi:Zn-dependent M16 (insulinase) family peptidase
LTAKDIKSIEKGVKRAIKENEVDLPHHLLKNMPSIPDVSRITPLRNDMRNLHLDDKFESNSFQAAQVILTDTAFCHFGLAFHIGSLPDDLRPYLVLFQELLFQSSLAIPGTKMTMRMDYREVAKYVSDAFVSHECGVGFGNSVFSVSYLCQLFTMFITCNPKDWDRAVRFVSQVLLFSEFSNDRIITIGKNLISDIVDTKRDGNSVMSAVANRVVCDPRFVATLGNNELAISIFEQESFLKKVVQDCESGSGHVVDQLNKVRMHLLSDSACLNFIRICVPFSFVSSDLSDKKFESLTHDVLRIWNSELEKNLIPLERKRKLEEAQYHPFPFPRIPYSLYHFDNRFSNSLLVPVAGLTTCYLTQFVPCDLLKSCKDPDYFPTVLLAEILSRTEGPLYTSIRGQGYAYGAYLNCFIWAGQLSFELYRTSEPKLALQSFYHILEELGTEVGFSKICSDYEIQTAQASIAYRWVSSGSTTSAIISTALRTTLQGFRNLKEHGEFVDQLYKVSRSDLKRCYEKYFKLFFTNSRVTVVTAPTGESVKTLKESFMDSSMRKDYQLDFTVYNLQDFGILEPPS